MALAYDATRVTRDVDARFVPHGIVLDEARNVARDLGLPPWWLNEQASVYISGKDDPGKRRVFDHPGLRVAAASPAHIFAMKALAARTRDIDDLRVLADIIGVQSAGEALQIYCLRADAGTAPDGRPALQWRFDQAAIDAEAATDGWYALLTNLPADVTAPQVLARYKNQPAASERRYHDLKGPLAVAPMFLHANRRITAIIGVICMALLIYSLIERQARRNLAPATRLNSLYAGRPAKPTAQTDPHHPGHPAPRDGAGDRPPQIPQPALSSSNCSTCSKS